MFLQQIFCMGTNNNQIVAVVTRGFTESLRQELAQFNIDVILIEPGAIRSNFFDNSRLEKIIIQRIHRTQAPYRRYLKASNRSWQIHLTQEM